MSGVNNSLIKTSSTKRSFTARCVPWSNGLRGRQNSFTPILTDEEEQQRDDRQNCGAVEESNSFLASNEVCFLPDLEALRFWSHPRSNSFTMQQQRRQQGVLWKRRDIFAKQWRPRWFVLHPNQGILTYYLLSESVSDRIAEVNSELRDPMFDSFIGDLPESIVRALHNRDETRHRTSSWDSGNFSEHAADYDVEPRGTIYLVGCSVAPNHGLSKRNQQLFVLTISPPNASDTKIHLAARNEQVRDRWVEQLQRVCQAIADSDDTNDNQGERQSPTRTRANTGDVSLLSNDGNNSHSATAEVQSNDPPLQVSDDARSLSTSTSPNWTSLERTSRLFTNLPDGLADRIQQTIHDTLPLVDDEEDGDIIFDPAQWKELYRRDTASAYLRKNSAKPMLKATAIIDNYSPLQVFDLLVDPNSQHSLDSTIGEASRLQVFNPHTFVEYCTYNSAWPTSPREVAYVLHWQVVVKQRIQPDDGGGGGGDVDGSVVKDGNNKSNKKKDMSDDRAILIVAFSCPEAESIRGRIAEGHVRATLHVSLTLLKPRRLSFTSCRMIRVWSMDLGGFQAGVQLTNLVLSQRANYFIHLVNYFKDHEPEPDVTTLKGQLSDNEICKKIVARQGTYRNRMDTHRRATSSSRGGRSSPENGSSRDPFIIVDSSDDDKSKALISKPSLLTQASLLFLPIAVVKVTIALGIPCSLLWFLISIFVAVRQIALLYAGMSVFVVPTSQQRLQLAGPVTCRFQIDLKGIFRFIANKKEEREDLKHGAAEISVAHIVACAVARALHDEKQLNVRRLCIPWLLIDVLRHNTDGVTVTILENDGRPITLNNVDTTGVQDIADQALHTIKAPEQSQQQQQLGQCLVLAMTNHDQIDMETDAASNDPNVRMVAVVGGVRLERNHRRRGRASHGSPVKGSVQPMLALSLTMSGGKGYDPDYASCRRFAEEVQKLLQFPEMCEN